MAVITRKVDEKGTPYINVYVPSDATLLIGAVKHPRGGFIDVSKEALLDLRNVIDAFLSTTNAAQVGTHKFDA